MDKNDIKEFVKGLNKSYTIPSLMSRILAITRNENSSPQELYNLISHDQALAERVIILANSAMFGHSGNVKSIKHAVLFLGYNNIKSIALAMAVMDIFPAHTSFKVKNLWIHGYEVAYIAAAISDAVSMAAPSEIFLCGLLHDIGRVILYRKDHDKFFEIGVSDDIFDKEIEMFGCTHAEVGSLYAEHVRMPDDIVLAIRHHHQPSKTSGNKLGVSIVAIAEALSRRFSPRIEDDGIWTEEHDAILLELSLGEDELQSIGEKLGRLRREIERFFT